MASKSNSTQFVPTSFGSSEFSWGKFTKIQVVGVAFKQTGITNA